MWLELRNAKIMNEHAMWMDLESLVVTDQDWWPLWLIWIGKKHHQEGEQSVKEGRIEGETSPWPHKGVKGGSCYRLVDEPEFPHLSAVCRPTRPTNPTKHNNI